MGSSNGRGGGNIDGGDEVRCAAATGSKGRKLDVVLCRLYKTVVENHSILVEDSPELVLYSELLGRLHCWAVSKALAVVRK